MNLMRLLLVLFSISLICIQPLRAQHPILFGVTDNGGNHYDEGTIFSFDLVNHTENVIYNFSLPIYRVDNLGGDLIYDDTRGVFYSINPYGGSMDSGGIYALNPVDDSVNIVCSFMGGTDITTPVGNMVYDPDNGLYYGVSFYGGPNEYGQIFSFDPATGGHSILWSFDGYSSGKYPIGLTYDPDNGLLYGIAGGPSSAFIYSFNPQADTVAIAWNFSYSIYSYSPSFSSTLYYDAYSKLMFATTSNGGDSGLGTIYSFNPVNDTAQILYSFRGASDGQYPSSLLIKDSLTGLLYGTTSQGGDTFLLTGSGGAAYYTGGTLFSFNLSTHVKKVLYNFGSGLDGQSPFGSLVYDKDSKLYYGLTRFGGANNPSNGGYGTIFSFDPGTNTEQTLWSFGNDSIDGKSPEGSLSLFSFPNGIKSITTSPSISIYPNPATNTLFISGASKNQTIEIYNCLGQRLRLVSVETGTTEINIASFENGIYLVQIANEDGSNAESKSIVKRD